MSSCKSIIVFGVILLLSQMAASPLCANPLGAEVVISQTGPGTGSWTTGLQESNAASWSSPFTYSDVKISAKLIGTATGTAYLTTKIGPTTTSADLLKSAPFTENSNVPEWVMLFSGLTLGPGTYYLTLGSPAPCCSGWANTFDPTVVTAPGVMYNGSYFTTNAMAGFNLAFPPASTFASFETFGLAPLQFQVIVPEASTLVLLGSGLGALSVLWMRRKK
jgi:hypothetical protein